MAEKITPRFKDFSQWYQDIVIQARLADYSPVKGCMVIRPQGYSIWERIQQELNDRIQQTGVQNAYFPLFIPESFLKQEAQHVEGFSPQCAVVTHAGAQDLEEKLVVRPTSETMINSMFSKWIQSYRDLPLLINQWANVVRWEMRTRLFLRTTEFLWQEGHTCHATPEEADERARGMLKLYEKFAREVLAMPVRVGQKTQSERFAGAFNTYSMEALMQDGKALQAGTSHDLSTNFAKAFGTQFLDAQGHRQWVYQTSWGVSTRLIGGIIMTHSDDQGLVLPPRLAKIHVIIVPIFSKKEGREQLLEASESLKTQIQEVSGKNQLPYPLGIQIDRDESKQTGWKFHEYELLGIPLRIELGHRELEKMQVIVKRRDQAQKKVIDFSQVGIHVVEELQAMQMDLWKKAQEWRDARTHSVQSYHEFQEQLEKPDAGFLQASWCQSPQCEAQVKLETKATIRCLPWDDQDQVEVHESPCLVCGHSGHNVRALFARSY